jgi:hypothetical protein
MAKKLTSPPVLQHKGWSIPIKAASSVTNKLKQENDELKERLAALEEAVAGLGSKKGKK